MINVHFAAAAVDEESEATMQHAIREEHVLPYDIAARPHNIYDEQPDIAVRTTTEMPRCRCHTRLYAAKTR